MTRKEFLKILCLAVATGSIESMTGGCRRDPRLPSADINTRPPKNADKEQREKYEVFHPKDSWNLEKLKVAGTPSYEKMLNDHKLTEKAIQRRWMPQVVGWEPALYTVELTPDKYGNTKLPLLPGYVYTVALSDGSVEIFWGGDPKIGEVNVQWGFSARWVPAYLEGEGKWLNPDDPRELAAREYRFGRYLRNPAMVDIRPDVPYFGRFGPYYTGTGNLDVGGWVPPDLNATVPRNYMDACAMLGGRCNEKEWISAESGSGGYLNWSWKYEGKKVSGSADYCPPGDPCWQTVYIPSQSRGYVELWLSTGSIGPDGKPVENAGPYKFYAQDAHILQDGLHNVDEFTYHADPNR